MDGAGEGAAAHELNRIGALFGEIGERLYQLLIEVGSGCVPRPGMDDHLGKLEILAERKAAEHRQTAEERMDMLFDDRLGAATALLLQTILGCLHGAHYAPRP
jgi:hypothetical protein